LDSREEKTNKKSQVQTFRREQKKTQIFPNPFISQFGQTKILGFGNSGYEKSGFENHSISIFSFV